MLNGELPEGGKPGSSVSWSWPRRVGAVRGGRNAIGDGNPGTLPYLYCWVVGAADPGDGAGKRTFCHEVGWGIVEVCSVCGRRPMSTNAGGGAKAGEGTYVEKFVWFSRFIDPNWVIVG